MGLSGIVSAAFVSILLLTGAAYVVTLNIDMMKTTTQPFEEYIAREDVKLGEACTIDSWVNVSRFKAKINITNTGESGIRISDFDEIDLILTYNTSTGLVIDWLPFDQDAASLNYWKVSDVYTNGQQGDFVNPINLSGSIYGLWDPGETIEVLVYTDSIASSYQYVKVSLPHGTVVGYSMA